MSRVVDLRPPAKREPPTQCEVTVEEMGGEYNVYYSDYRKKSAARKGYTPDQCNKQAKYQIDGRKLCAFHAGIAAISILQRQRDD